MLILELLESRRLLSTGGGSQGVATAAGPDTNVWFTMNSNAIGMINPSNPAPASPDTPFPPAARDRARSRPVRGNPLRERPG